MFWTSLAGIVRPLNIYPIFVLLLIWLIFFATCIRILVMFRGLIPITRSVLVLINFLSPIFNSVQSTLFSPCCFSDHDHVNLCFVPDDNAVRGPGLWKFNNSFLSDNTFCDFVSELIDDFANCLDHFSSVRGAYC